MKIIRYYGGTSLHNYCCKNSISYNSVVSYIYKGSSIDAAVKKVIGKKMILDINFLEEVFTSKFYKAKSNTERYEIKREFYSIKLSIEILDSVWNVVTSKWLLRRSS